MYTAAYVSPPQGRPKTWAEVEARGDPVREQQIKTSFMARETFWYHRDVPWVWVPTLHGLEIDEYVWHAKDMRDLIWDMQSYYGSESAFRVAIGSLCRPLKQGELHDIIRTILSILPGVRIHLWGIKYRTFRDMRYALPECDITCDSSIRSALANM